VTDTISNDLQEVVDVLCCTKMVSAFNETAKKVLGVVKKKSVKECLSVAT